MAKVSESVMIDIKDTITIFDKVGDGKLNVNDIVNALRSLGKVYTIIIFFQDLWKVFSCFRFIFLFINSTPVPNPRAL